MRQADNLARLPFLHKHVALMPDTHQGYGMPIGGVIATNGVVIPNAVGVDIGCGMVCAKTNVHISDIDPNVWLREVMGHIRARIPVGHNHREKMCDIDDMPPTNGFLMEIVNKEYDSARKQLGTLGGGNHFIEIQKDEKGFIWVMIHSGSRNLGKRVADFHNAVAVKINKLWLSSVPESHELAFLPAKTDEAVRYMNEMAYCLAFAKANRKKMMDDVLECMEQDVVAFRHDIHHNYAKWENHFGENVIVHRKGATSARLGEIGIIPGSQGSNSYIVKGLGNPDSFMSCSHGAGRKMGRKEATRKLVLADEIAKMEKMGVIHSLRNEKDLDEAASAYKDIDVVMKEQADLVEIIEKLTPLAVIKG